MSTIREFDDVTVEGINRVAVLRLNDPKTLNAISPRMIGGIGQALDYIDTQSAVFRVLLMTGAGRGFCSGANLTATGAHDALRADDLGRALREIYNPLMRRLRGLKMLMIVAVNGPAVGFGFSLALMGDILLAARSAFFQLSFARIGLVPDGGAAWLLTRIVGLARAKELIVLAERLSAEKAHEWGLVNQVHDDDKLMSAAMALANALAERPPATIALLRRLYWEALENKFEQQLELEAQLQSAAGKSGDFIEAVKAFREKRLPNFKGK
jgi:2-(1,2-epoxy-1,2-dihydrophenyl)acetyl-CoA isomerase